MTIPEKKIYPRTGDRQTIYLKNVINYLSNLYPLPGQDVETASTSHLSGHFLKKEKTKCIHKN